MFDAGTLQELSLHALLQIKESINWTLHSLLHTHSLLFSVKTCKGLAMWAKSFTNVCSTMQDQENFGALEVLGTGNFLWVSPYTLRRYDMAKVLHTDLQQMALLRLDLQPALFRCSRTSFNCSTCFSTDLLQIVMLSRYTRHIIQ